LFVGQRVLSERQDHKLGAVDEHYSTAILWIYTDDGDMNILDKAILQMQKPKSESEKTLFILKGQLGGG